MTAGSARTITVEQARAELDRRRLPKERRHEGREQAIASGTFYVATATLVAIVEGGS